MSGLCVVCVEGCGAEDVEAEVEAPSVDVSFRGGGTSTIIAILARERVGSRWFRSTESVQSFSWWRGRDVTGGPWGRFGSNYCFRYADSTGRIVVESDGRMSTTIRYC